MHWQAGAVLVADRFWLPHGDSAPLTAEGWLRDPVSSLWIRPATTTLTTAALSSIRCVVLLGSPGIGKSTVLGSTVVTMPDQDNVVAIRFDLGSYTTDAFLYQQVFQDPRVLEW